MSVMHRCFCHVFIESKKENKEKTIEKRLLKLATLF